MQLTGPPRLNSLILPRPAMNSHMHVEWDPSESTYRRYRSGQVELVERRYRGRIRFGYQGLQRDQFLAIIGEVGRGPTVRLVPRTRAAGDPDWIDETELECRVMSALPSTARLAGGRFPLELEMETVQVYPKAPGMLAGGLSLVTEDETSYTFQAAGDLYFLEEAYQVAFQGQTYTRTRVRMMPPPLAALRYVDERDRETKITYEIET